MLSHLVTLLCEAPHRPAPCSRPCPLLRPCAALLQVCSPTPAPLPLFPLLQQLGSSLGYAALLLDVLSRFLQLPLLHRASFQGSTSCAWQPDSFWDMRAQPPAGALPLYAPPSRSHDGHGSGAAGQLYSAVAGMAGGGAGGGAAAAAAAEARVRQDLQRALYWLQRSAGVLVHARLGPDAPLKLPPGWSPFAWLGGLCKMLAAEPRLPLSVSRVMATPNAHGHGYPPAHPHARLAAMGGLAASAVFGRVSPQQDGYMGQSMMWPGEVHDAAVMVCLQEGSCCSAAAAAGSCWHEVLLGTSLSTRAGCLTKQLLPLSHSLMPTANKREAAHVLPVLGVLCR